jgi:hypothetical protein
MGSWEVFVITMGLLGVAVVIVGAMKILRK